MDITLPADIQYIIGALENAGHSAYAVGGCVRDVLRGAEPHDWDVCTSAAPGQVKRCFADRNVVDTGLKHGTVTLVIDRRAYEITTFRIDGAYGDSRRPDTVTFTDDVRADLERRDFTVNAMAYSEKSGLIDMFGGAEDLKNGVIRCVGDADTRLREDALRIMRALRFASTLGFAIAPETSDALRRNKLLLRNIASERVASELVRILTGRGAGFVLRGYADIIAVIIPELEPSFGFEQHHRHHDLDVWNHTVKSVESAPEDPVVRLTMLLHDIAKPQCYTNDGEGHFYGHQERGAEAARVILSRLRFDNATKSVAAQLIRYHDSEILPQPKYVRRWLRKIGEERFLQLLDVKRADALAQAPDMLPPKLAHLDAVRGAYDSVIARGECFSLGDLAVNGRDLIAAGVKPGSEIGAKLDYMLGKVVDGEVANERAALLRLLEGVTPPENITQ